MSIPRKLRFLILRRDHFTCRYCGRHASAGALEVDHIVPASEGGSDEPSNLVTACIPCNQGKAAMMLMDEISFAVEVAYYQFEVYYLERFDDATPAQLRTYWNREIAPYLKGSMERCPPDNPAMFALAIGGAEVIEGTRAYREGTAPTPWAALLAFHTPQPTPES